jgi:hypothetical protein
MMKNDKRRELSVIKNPGAMPTSFAMRRLRRAMARPFRNYGRNGSIYVFSDYASPFCFERSFRQKRRFGERMLLAICMRLSSLHTGPQIISPRVRFKRSRARTDQAGKSRPEHVL